MESFAAAGPTTATATNTPACPGDWTSQATYPVTIMDNAVAAQGGFVYSFGGFNGSVVVSDSYKYNTGTNTVYAGGEHESYLLLPIIPKSK